MIETLAVLVTMGCLVTAGFLVGLVAGEIRGEDRARDRGAR